MTDQGHKDMGSDYVHSKQDCICLSEHPKQANHSSEWQIINILQSYALELGCTKYLSEPEIQSKFVAKIQAELSKAEKRQKKDLND